MGATQTIKHFLWPFYKTIFKTHVENKRLKKENEELRYQIKYLERHFDIGKMKPASGLLREIQLTEVEFAAHILDLLKPYNIPLYLEGGALLGTVRHGGFIPWDDDVDLAMGHKDYFKLLKIFEKDANFIVIDSRQKSGNYLEYYDKQIRANPNKNIVIRSPTCTHIFNGTSIRDAKNLELFPNDFLKERATEKEFLAFREKVNAFINGPATWREIFDFYDTAWQECGLYSAKPTSRVAHGLGNWVFTEYAFHGFRKFEDIYPLKTITFEGYEFPCPANIEASLISVYGNSWREYPQNIGFPLSTMEKNKYYKAAGEPLIKYQDF